MSIRNILMTSAALAMLTPLIAASPSLAAGRGFAGNAAAGIAASPRGMAAAGGGVHMGGGGGGWNHGGVAMGGGSWNHGGGGGGWHHGGGRGWGGGFIPGAVAGAVIGGAIANSNAYYGGPGYYDQQYGYYDQPDYYDDSAVVAAPVGDDAVGYCSQRFRSYDPGSGTYLGYDGLRHPCP